ncbi:2-carboxy-1,4-naphthoquinone phytyltransferase [Acaryochloris sp. IP29b_bin.137]|uniref:2-carboxy-1,4-naphthoquinone phytyltransferase n=1 Tax=Acaryochloris sp. IP29b_bin.137 TaxID=2969217 RepID=UPI00262040D4|nr:2-carboxy-1,4-naphthoquinone phytyltransferase [Acaryochloris sp. IP29b_bin.137]
MTTKSLPTANRKLWWAAIKPPMYSVAVIPIWVGSAIAWSEQHHLETTIFWTFLGSAILIIAWLNLTNDVFDADTGIDVNKAHSLVNLTGNQPLIFGLANSCLGLGCLGLVAIAWWQQDVTVLVLILLSCFLGYTYQGPPFRLGYQGLGEIICFFTFGPLAVSAAYYSQAQSWSSAMLAASVIIGLTTSLILFCSHFHQVEDDLAAGKRSPIARMGTTRGAQLLPWICSSIFSLILMFTLLRLFAVGALLTLISLPLAVHLCRHVWQHHHQPDQVRNCKFIAVGFHFVSGLLLGLGLLV